MVMTFLFFYFWFLMKCGQQYKKVFFTSFQSSRNLNGTFLLKNIFNWHCRCRKPLLCLLPWLAWVQKGATALSTMTLSMMTVTHHKMLIWDSQIVNAMVLCCVSLFWVSRFIHHYAEWHYAECQILFILMLTNIMLSVALLNVVMLSVLFPSKEMDVGGVVVNPH